MKLGFYDFDGFHCHEMEFIVCDWMMEHNLWRKFTYVYGVLCFWWNSFACTMEFTNIEFFKLNSIASNNIIQWYHIQFNWMVLNVVGMQLH